MIIGLEFPESVFMHAITFVNDLYDYNASVADFWDSEKLFQNYQIYIGES